MLLDSAPWIRNPTKMNIRVTPARTLSTSDIAAWSQIQQANPALDSPFFRPEFNCAVAAVRDDVEVAVLEADGNAVGFWPFQRDRGHVARPVGGWLSDFQGVIASDANWNPAHLAQACGLRAWVFDHALGSQAPLRPYHTIAGESPFIDLSLGFEAYRRERQSSRSDQLQQVLRKGRKLGREQGRVRFEPHTTSLAVLGQLIDWKMEQYRQLKVINYLGPAWSTGALEEMLTHRGEHFSAMMSVLWVDKRPAAIHLGLRAGAVLHSWFPVYDRNFAKYSPGLILLMEIAQAAESLGVKRIDLGKGPEPYKQSFSTGTTAIAEGAVDFRRLSRLLSRSWLRTRELIRNSRFRTPAQRVVRGARGWLLYRKKRQTS